MSDLTKGRVTIPTNLDVVPETIDILKRWGADAIRDCDGTEFPEELILNDKPDAFKARLKRNREDTAL